MVNIKKSSYMLLLSEDADGVISLLKLRRNFTYPFDAVIFGSQIDVCYLFGILSYLTKDELLLLLYLYEATQVTGKSYLEALISDDVGALSEQFPNLFSYCGNNFSRFSSRLAGLKAEFKAIIEISSHEKAVAALVAEILSILEKESFSVNSKPLVYPGGRGRKDDATFLDTAIRETFEEMHIRRDGFRVLHTKPLFRETYISSDNVRYAQMFFLAKLDPKGIEDFEVELEGIFNEVVAVPLEDLDEEDLLENTIKNIDLSTSLKDAKNYVTEILTSKQFLDTDVFKNYNTGKVIRDYKTAITHYLASDILEK